MKVTINKVDGIVGKDGEFYAVDTSQLPGYLRVVQWDTFQGAGWIEWQPDSAGRVVPNTTIVDLAPYQYLLDGWALKKAEAEELKKQQEEFRRLQAEATAKAVEEASVAEEAPTRKKKSNA